MLIRVSILHRAHSIQSLSKCAYYVRAVKMEKEVDIFLIIPLTGQCHRSLRSLGPANNHYNYIIYNICLYASLALPMRRLQSQALQHYYKTLECAHVSIHEVPCYRTERTLMEPYRYIDMCIYTHTLGRCLLPKSGAFLWWAGLVIPANGLPGG